MVIPMGFAADVTPDEIALGFQRVEHLAHGLLVTARLGIGIRAVKMIDDGMISYAICDDHFIVLYPPSHSIPDLRRRFELGDRKAG